MNRSPLSDAQLDTVLGAYRAPQPSADFAARVAATAVRPGRPRLVERRQRRRPWARRGIIAGVVLANLLAVSAIAAVLQGHPLGLRIASLAHHLFARPVATRSVHPAVHALAQRMPAPAAMPPAITAIEPPSGAASPLAAPPLRYAAAPIVARALHPAPHPLARAHMAATIHRTPEHRLAPREARERFLEERRERRLDQHPPREHDRAARAELAQPRAVTPPPVVPSRELAQSERPREELRERPSGATPATQPGLQQRGTWRERWAAWRRDGVAQRNRPAQGESVGEAAGRPDADVADRAGAAAGPRQPNPRQPGAYPGRPGAGQRQQRGGWRRLFARGGRKRA